MFRLWLLGCVTILAAGFSVFGQEIAQEKQSKPAERQESTSTGPWIQFNVDGSYLGAFLEEVTADRMKELGLTQERGAIVMKVVKDSPAEKAGLKENDVILSFNGRPVDSVREFERLLGDTPAGRTVALEISRGGNRQSLSATVTKRDYFGLAKNYMADGERLRRHFDGLNWQPYIGGNFDGSFELAPFMAQRPRLGISGEPITDQLAGFFGVKEGRGVLISEVTEGSAAAKGGLKAGDVIVAVDGAKIESVSDLRNQLSKKQEGALVFKVVRNHQETSVTVTLEKSTANERRVQRVSAPRTRIFRPLQTI